MLNASLFVQEASIARPETYQYVHSAAKSFDKTSYRYSKISFNSGG